MSATGGCMMLAERMSVQQTKTNQPKHMSNDSHYSRRKL